MAAYTPRTGAKCGCKRGVQRDNCPTCEGTGWVIDFKAIHAKRRQWDRSACQEQVCTCHDDTAQPYSCSGCGCRENN